MAASGAQNNNVPRIKLAIFAALTAVIALSGCTSTASSQNDPQPSLAPHPTSGEHAMGSTKAASELAGRAAAAKDKHYTAEYKLTRGNKKDAEPVTVKVAVATDGTWRIDIPGGAEGGKSDVTLAWNRQGYYQCTDKKESTCISIADAADDVPKKYDPVIQHVFTDWLDILLNHNAPLSTAFTKALPGAAKGTCYSLKRNSVNVAAPLPTSVYCVTADGTITAVRSSFGRLELASKLRDASPNTTLPADTGDDEPLGTSPPPSPKPSPSKSGKSTDASKDAKKSSGEASSDEKSLAAVLHLVTRGAADSSVVLHDLATTNNGRWA